MGEQNDSSDAESGSAEREALSPPTSSTNARTRALGVGTGNAAGFPIVGLGASAGGLKALEEFLEQTPHDTGAAFVVVTHQRAGHVSHLPDILRRKTAMIVHDVTEVMPIQPNHVYVTPPGLMSVKGGCLQPATEIEQAPPSMPIDHFFRSLANDQGENAIVVVLSGTGSDGSLGIRAVRGHVGLVMVQDPQTAEYGDMPQSAVATGFVDHVLPAADLPGRIVEYLDARRKAAQTRPNSTLSDLKDIFELISDRTSHDFSRYKRSTMGRRIERRMLLHRISDLESYVAFLRENPEEIDQLFKELLIGVTSFFRDSEAWESFSKAAEEYLESKSNQEVLRVWIPGCSTGEEAYSMAIALREIIERQHYKFNVQIFATDIDANAIDTARLGTYPKTIASDVSSERLARFFTQGDGDTYRIRNVIREMLIFAPQNLISSPPFVQIDILSCRNLLIYLDSALQERLPPLFHYSLAPRGLLFMGSSESVGGFDNLFEAVDKKWKIYRRRDASAPTYVPAGVTALRFNPSATTGTSTRNGARSNIDPVVIQSLLKEFVPPTVFVRERGDIVFVQGDVGAYLFPPQGNPASANVFDMARHGIELALSTALRQARYADKEVTQPAVCLDRNGESHRINIKAIRLAEPATLRGLFRVSFDSASPFSLDSSQAPSQQPDPVADRILALESELQYSKESHQSTLAELQTSNEELQSANEELQSTNEELETSKEEMQSLNEELQTVNAELHSKLEELTRTNNDMKNLLNATNIATVFLDEGLRIKRFTEQATRVIRLIPTDVGRPIGDLVSNLDYDGLVTDAREVLRTLVFRETEVHGEDGAFYLMRILPYRTIENVIDGLVLTFVDVTAHKARRDKEALDLDAFSKCSATVFIQDPNFKITSASGPAFGKSPDELIGKNDADLLDGQHVDGLRTAKELVLKTGKPAKYHLEFISDGKRRENDVFIEGNRNSQNEVVGLVVLVVDTTDISPNSGALA